LLRIKGVGPIVGWQKSVEPNQDGRSRARCIDAGLPYHLRMLVFIR
jgi:hypothetical protein